MWLSMLSVWASLLTLVASQSCPDQSEESTSWVRLKPLGQCKDGESTCPYRITLPPLTIQLPKSFRELDKMARELQSLTQMVNQLREDCRECKEMHGTDRNIRTDNEGEDGERIQASRGTLNTKERSQDIAKRESTIKVTTSRSALEDTMIISSDAKDVNQTAFGKQRNTNQERNLNPRTTKPKAETNRGPKGSNPSPEKNISGSMSNVGEVPSLTATKQKILQSPLAKLNESSFSGDLDSEQPTQHEKHKSNTIKAGHEMFPSGTLTARGKVKSIPEYHVVTMVIEDDDDDDYDDDDDAETKYLQTPEGDKDLGETSLVTGTDAQNNRELESNKKQLPRKPQEKVDKKVGETGLKETRSNIFDHTNSGNVAKEGSVSVIQQPNLKNKGKNNHGAGSTKPGSKPSKPGAYSERDTEVNSRPVTTADTIRGQKKLTSPVTGRANTAVNVSQITPQTLEIKSKTDADAKMETGIVSNQFNTAETGNEHVTSRSPISSMTYGTVDVSPNPQTSDSKKQLNTGTDSESDAGMNLNPVNKKTETRRGQESPRSPISGTARVNPTRLQIIDSKKRLATETDSESDVEMNLNPVNNVDSVNIVKNLGSPISDRVNTTADVILINPETQKSNTQTSFKSSRNPEKKTATDSNPVNKTETRRGQESPRSPISGTARVNPTTLQIVDSKKRLATDTDSESDVEMNLNPVNNVDSVNIVKNSRPPISDRVNTTAGVDLINPETQKSNTQTSFKSNRNPEKKTVTVMDSNPVNKTETRSEQESPRSPISGTARVNPTRLQIVDSKKQLATDTDSESDVEMNLNPVNNVDSVNIVKNLGSPISDRFNTTAGVDLINPLTQKSNTQTSFKSSRNPEKKTATDSNPVNKTETRRGQESPRSPISGTARVNPTRLQIVDSKKQLATDTDSESDVEMNLNPVNNVDSVSGSENSRSFISDRANSTADVDGINPQSLNSQNPFTHGIKSNKGANSNPFNTTETVSRLQMPKSSISDITNAAEVNQTHPGTLDGTFKDISKPGTDKEKKTEMDSKPLDKVEKVSPLEIPQLSVTEKADDKVNVNQINPQTVHSNSEKTFKPAPDSESEVTVVSTPVNKVETVSQIKTSKAPLSGSSRATVDQINPRAMDNISKNPLIPGIISKRKYPNQDHTNDTVSQREQSESSISDSRLDVSSTNPHLNSNDDLPKRQSLPKSKLNMTQPRNGQINSSNPISIDPERRKALRNNKTISLRKETMRNGRYQPTGLFPMRTEKQQEKPNPPERNDLTRLSASKDPRRRRPYILQEKPIVNESKAFVSAMPKNTSGVTYYNIRNGTTHDSKTVSSPNNKLNSRAYDMTQSVMPTLATQGTMDQAHIKRANTAPTVKVLHKKVNHQIESTSKTTVTQPKLEKPGGNSGQDLVLDRVNNIGRDSRLPVVKETKGTNRRTGKTPFRTSSPDSNHETHKKPLRVGTIQDRVGKMPVAVGSSERNELNYPTTAATPYTTKAEFKNKHSKMPHVTPPATTTPHFMDQDREEQAKTTSGVKVSNKHVYHRLKNPSQEMESKRSHSDTGNKELQSASNGQVSSAGTDLQPNSLDSIQNRATASTDTVTDRVKASTGSKVKTPSTGSTNENRARDTNPVVMDKVKASTEANWLIPSSDNSPVTYHGYSKTPLGSADSVEGNNGEYSIDNNNGNSYPVSVNRMTGATLHKIPAGQTNYGDNKKPLTVNNMDDRQGLEKQLLSNCHGCDLSPSPRSVLNSHESSNNDRDKPAQDCSDFMTRNPTSGIYNVTPTESNNRTFPVFCDMKSSGGGWTLIQHRFNGSISFNRTWNDYKKGFGNLTGEFWLGNDKIHWLTTSKVMVLRIELEDLDGVKEYAQYNHFHVANESQYYRLTIEGYSGTAGDAMLYSKKFNHNQKNFTTPDRDNDQYTSGNCGDYYSSGWWFDSCMAANLNGKYYETRYKGVRNGIFWGTWHNISTESYLTHDRQSFKTVRMMIRPRTGLLMD